MIRRRGHGDVDEESSSDDEEDAFSALSKKTNAKKKVKIKPSSSSCIAIKTNPNDDSKKPSGPVPIVGSSSVHTPSLQEPSRQKLPISTTSSMKRHHKPSDTRKAKMDALLQELETEKDQIPKKTKRFVPEKRGSFVDPDEEHLTTNLFVGNLAPSITEEDLSNLFSQFGELYSVKIMWPRTMEEKNRRRNTGFVCFMNRDDAEEAIEACNNTDPFNNGRLLSLRWGKSVKKIRREKDRDTRSSAPEKKQRNHVDIGKEGSGTPSTNPQPGTGTREDGNKRSVSVVPTPSLDRSVPGKDITRKVPLYSAEVHAARAIRVEIPANPSRVHFITTTASYVAKDPELEQYLKEEEKDNAHFQFLASGYDDDDELQKEKIFYRWRVYSFCQGDTYAIWRTEPFLMFSNGRYWIPPPLNADAANRERANAAAEKENRQRQQKENRANRELLMTGRQFERRKRRGDFGSNHSKLNSEGLERFDELVRKQLSISRKTICEAMSFCFDNCMAAKEVSGLIKDALLDESDSISNDTRIARLYLLSDILFNSQQPGVRNAFMFRTTIESMAAETFRILGRIVRRKERSSGRITVNKLRKAVSAVLGAWTEWGVYQASFLDDLEAHFEGREVKSNKNELKKDENNGKKETEGDEIFDDAEEVVIHGPRGDWKEVSDEVKKSRDKKTKKKRPAATPNQPSDDPNHEKPLVPTDNSTKSKPGKTPDGHPHSDHASRDNVKVEGLDGEDLDGNALDGEDPDGDALDGEDLDGEELDGEDLDGEDLDGEALDCADMDGESIDGEGMDN